MTQTIRNVAITKHNEDDQMFLVMVDDEQDILPFPIHPSHVVRLGDELADLSWCAEVEVIDGLVEYLEEFSIFPVEASDNGFTVNCSLIKTTGGAE